MLLLALALLASLGFKTLSLVNEAQQLKTAIAGQKRLIEAGQQIRSQLQELAGQTLALADAGNANAATVIDEIGKKGINLKGTHATTDAPDEEQ